MARRRPDPPLPEVWLHLAQALVSHAEMPNAKVVKPRCRTALIWPHFNTRLPGMAVEPPFRLIFRILTPRFGRQSVSNRCEHVPNRLQFYTPVEIIRRCQRSHGSIAIRPVAHLIVAVTQSPRPC